MSEATEPLPTSGARAISVSEFRANCPKLLAAVRDTGEELVVTRHGHPVARVAPLKSHPAGTLVGMAADIIHLPPDLDVDAMNLLDPDWQEQWSAKWDRRIAAGTGPSETVGRDL